MTQEEMDKLPLSIQAMGAVIGKEHFGLRLTLTLEQIRAGGMVIAPHKFCTVIDSLVDYVRNGTIPPEPPKKEKEETQKKGKEKD